MIVVIPKKKKNNRFCTKTPFFIFFKHRTLKLLKRSLQTSLPCSLGRKKVDLPSHLITSSSSSLSHTVYGDSNSFSYRRSDTFLHTINSEEDSTLSTLNNKLSSFKDSNGSSVYFSRGMKYLNDPSMAGRLFNSIYCSFSGKLLYKPSNGLYAEIVSLSSSLFFISVRLPSGANKKMPVLSVGTLGRSSGYFHSQKYIGKFRFSHKSISVRGIAMNPVDHPNGGRSNIKKPFMNKYNKLAKHSK